ncbi:SUMF1/EgtB/PvdO family nonheme iron enzyme [Patescibacteria group bacterium]|nr:SUMF1/EgtB/PvdO family nonheme iron enzyme [Patescibacteria group bacterium]
MALIEAHKSVLELSLRRTGSTTIHRALISHPDISGQSEPFSFHTRSRSMGQFDRSDPMSPVNFSSIDDLDSVYLHRLMREHPTETWFLRNILSNSFSSSVLLPKVRLTKETFVAMHLGLLLELLPKDLQILYVTRDLRGIAASYKTNDLVKKWHVPELFLQIRDTVMSNKVLSEKYGDLFDIDVEGASWTELLMRKLIVFQSELNDHLLKRKNTKVIEFENFLFDAREEIAGILRWIGVDIDEKVLEQADLFTKVHMDETSSLFHPLYQHRSQNDWVLSLTDQEIDMIEKICLKFNIPLKKIDRSEERKKAEQFRKEAKPRQTFVRLTENGNEYQEKAIPSRGKVSSELQSSLLAVRSEKESFFMSKYETTNEQFASFLNWLSENQIVHDDIRFLIYNPNRGKVKRGNDGQWKVKEKFLHHPVVSVSWLGAFLFSVWAGYRLPKLEEWARAYHQGGNISTDTRISNFNQLYIDNTNNVAFLEPDAIGLFDMSGNVKEWTDTFVSEESVATPGGSWEDTPLMMEKHMDNQSIAVLMEKNLGFRIASDTKESRKIEDGDLANRIKRVFDFLKNKEVAYKEISYVYNEIRSLFA